MQPQVMPSKKPMTEYERRQMVNRLLSGSCQGRRSRTPRRVKKYIIIY